MRLIDADELKEHAGRDRLDSRELILQIIDNAPTVKTTFYTEEDYIRCNKAYEEVRENLLKANDNLRELNHQILGRLDHSERAFEKVIKMLIDRATEK